MKTILFLKRLDLIVQLCALIIPLTVCSMLESDGGFIPAYFCVGGAQLLSFLFHLPANRDEWTVRGRRRYGWLLTCVVGVAAILTVLCRVWEDAKDAGAVALYLSILITPVMAVWYYAICLRETVRVAQAVQRQMLIVRNV